LEKSLHKLSEELEETRKGNEELERSLLRLSKELEETQKERDKAAQQLTRLKQHLLEKVSFSLYIFEAKSIKIEHDLKGQTMCWIL